MSVETWKWLFDCATVILIALTVVTGAGALLTGRTINKRQEAELREFRLDIAKANERAAEANKVAEQERLERVKIEERIAPRRLTQDQKAGLIQALKPFGKQTLNVLVFAVDFESMQLANDIVATMGPHGARWTVNPAAEMPTGRAVNGVLIEVPSNADSKTRSLAGANSSRFGTGDQ